jgi:hypothetical protein
LPERRKEQTTTIGGFTTIGMGETGEIKKIAMDGGGHVMDGGKQTKI